MATTTRKIAKAPTPAEPERGTGVYRFTLVRSSFIDLLLIH